MAQAAQVVGALLILAAYVLAQFGVLDQRSYRYLWLYGRLRPAAR
jgi:hypothetical protein